MLNLFGGGRGLYVTLLHILTKKSSKLANKQGSQRDLGTISRQRVSLARRCHLRGRYEVSFRRSMKGLQGAFGTPL